MNNCSNYFLIIIIIFYWSLSSGDIDVNMSRIPWHMVIIDQDKIKVFIPELSFKLNFSNEKMYSTILHWCWFWLRENITISMEDVWKQTSILLLIFFNIGGGEEKYLKICNFMFIPKGKNNPPTQVIVCTSTGLTTASSYSYRCRKCKTNYNYDMYGSDKKLFFTLRKDHSLRQHVLCTLNDMWWGFGDNYMYIVK